MNKGIKEQLEKLWCEDKDDVKPLDNPEFKGIHQEMLDYWKQNIEEPVIKPSNLSLNASNDVSPTNDRLKTNEGLK